MPIVFLPSAIKMATGSLASASVAARLPSAACAGLIDAVGVTSHGGGLEDGLREILIRKAT